MHYFIDGLKKYAVFEGRATRKQYWMFVLFSIIFYFVMLAIDGALRTFIFSLIFSLAMFLPTLSIAARRLHDTNRSGWWLLLYLVPIIGAIVLIVFLVLDSTEDNQYGPNPKAMLNADLT